MLSKILVTFLSVFIVLTESQFNSTNTDLVAINNKLALDLLHTFPTDGNNFFSPLSITTALLTVMNGAKGSTQEEFRQLFSLSNNSNINQLNQEVRTVLNNMDQKESQKLVLKLATLLMVTNGFPLLPEYKQLMTEMFDSKIESVDFKNNSKQIIKDINSWVSDKTNEKITTIFDENDVLPEDTPMVLVNAVYFKGMWKYVFGSKQTQKLKFFNFGDRNKFSMVDMMISERNLAIRYSKELEAIVFDMPFADGSDMNMVIILPDESVTLESVAKKLTPKTLNYTIAGITRRKGTTERLVFPKFKVETEYDLKKHLRTLGLKTVFEDNADLSGIDGKGLLKVSEAVHKAYVEVNEEGAEASGVTASVGLTRVPHIRFPPIEVKVDRPFLFLIQDTNNGLILFMGQVLYI